MLYEVITPITTLPLRSWVSKNMMRLKKRCSRLSNAIEPAFVGKAVGAERFAGAGLRAVEQGAVHAEPGGGRAVDEVRSYNFV